MSFGREPSSEGFAKHYELHYQLKKVVVDSFQKFQQFGVINFLVKRGSQAGLTSTIKNKWSVGWMNVWFYCKVPLHVCPRGGKSIHALRSHMSALNFHTKPSIEDSGEDLSYDAFDSPAEISEVGTLWTNSCLVVFGCWPPMSVSNM
jgi:hypothetical protein